MINVVIVPGLHGSEEGHWQTCWEAHMPGAIRVMQDDWHSPDLLAWSARLQQTVRPLQRFWIIAHSFGALTTLHALPGIIDRVAGVFLVAPADPDKFAVRHLLPSLPAPVCGALVASRSDPWMTFAGAEALAAQYGLPVLDAGDAGHINVESGHGEWLQGREWFAGLQCRQPVPH